MHNSCPLSLPAQDRSSSSAATCLSTSKTPAEAEAEAAAPRAGSNRNRNVRIVNSDDGGSHQEHHRNPQDPELKDPDYPSPPSLPALGCHSTHKHQAASHNSQQGVHYATTEYLCDSPIASTSVSDESMNNHGDDITPPESPAKAGSANHTGAATEQIGRLSLDHGIVIEGESSPPPCRGRGMLSAAAATAAVPVVAAKRSASSELSRPGGHQAPRCCDSQRASQAPRSSKTTSRLQQRRSGPSGPNELKNHARVLSTGEDHRRDSAAKAAFNPRCDKPRVREDSGYASLHPHQYPNACGNAAPRILSDNNITIQQQHPKSLVQLPAAQHSRYPGLMMQPHSSPISKEQLAAEVRGIYAGLVMVEAKCTSIDTAQAEDTKSVLEPEQWQALIALHRTLLYEHHDFLMATQHPSATPALRCLPAKYNMPARMWKHGIHAFLEVLRHRRPHSQQYMLAFIYLAYQMMALLYETVPSFTDTWIECLGDLARYRMAIEEEKEAHATWGGVAARWYTMASDRHPAIGRLYHHLGILERPSLRKLCFYAKSLTCVIPFQNARDSLSTLCTPIIQDERTVRSSSQNAEARIVTYHALLYARADMETIENVGGEALQLIQQQPSRLRDCGAYLAMTNIAALFGLGDPENILWKAYMAAINLSVQNVRTSTTQTTLQPRISDSPTSPALASSTKFWSETFSTVIKAPQNKNEDQRCELKDCLPYVNVMLVWLHSLLALQSKLSSIDITLPTPLKLLDWAGLATFLNLLAKQEGGISARISQYARRGMFPPARPGNNQKVAMPLAEDFLIRGLVWGQFYFSQGWFDGQGEDDGRGIESEEKANVRADRVLWLGLYLAFHTDNLEFDEVGRSFSSAAKQENGLTGCRGQVDRVTAVKGPAVVYAAADDDVSPAVKAEKLRSQPSSSENSEDGFAIVKKPRDMEDAKKGPNVVASLAKKRSSKR